ncbi:hypothetical protein ABIC27_001911 [Streptomyces sp. PvR034]
MVHGTWCRAERQAAEVVPLLLEEPLDDEVEVDDVEEDDEAEAAGADAVVEDAGLEAGVLLDEEPRLSFR